MDLKEIRKSIDRLDVQIVGLLQRRMKYALLAGRQKKTVRDTAREELLMQRLLARESAVVDAQFIREVYELIIAKSRQLQERKKKLAGFQGEHGTWSELALRAFEREMVPIPYRDLEELQHSVRTGEVDFGIFPVEGLSHEESTDLAVAADLNLAGEVVIPIRHNLMALPGCKPQHLRTVYSHPSSLERCRVFLRNHNLEPHPFYDSAGAARWLSAVDQQSAGVIAGVRAAEIYNLEILKEDVDDHCDAAGNFILLSHKEGTGTSGTCTVSCWVEDRPGSLLGTLSIFKEHEINLTRIECSNPRTKPEAPALLLEFRGSTQDPPVRRLIRSLQTSHIQFTFAGRYHKELQ